MPDQNWSSWGASVVGPLHIKTATPNQDFWLARSFKWGNVIVVSDGVGSKAHSDKGSQAACLSVVEAAKNLHKNPDASVLDVLRLIHSNWLVKIAPYSPSVCMATCLFAIQIDGHINLGRLGDGMIVALGENAENHLILNCDKDNSFSNYTNCLQQEFKPHQWEIATIESLNYNGILLCTDGIADDLLPEVEVAFAKEILKSYSDLPSQKRRFALNKMLNEWPVPNHSDDKTIACLVKQGAQK